MRSKASRAASCITTALMVAAAGAGPDFDLTWYTVDGGGSGVPLSSAGGPFELSGTIGQPDAGVMSGGEFELVGGFWAPSATSGAPLPGDCDGDGDVDLDDYVAFYGCLAGPDLGLGFGCECADLDGDADADLADFAEFTLPFPGG